MALKTAGTGSTTALTGVTMAPAGTLSAADLAAVAQSITGDGNFGAVAALNVPGARGILATGSTHSNTTLDTLVATGGGGLASIQIGMLVLGWTTSAIVIPPGTFVAAKPSATSVTLSQAAISTAAGLRVAFIPPGMSGRFSFEGLLDIPGRGVLKVLPGDKVLIDNTGWPILLSGNTISYAGSVWTFSA